MATTYLTRTYQSGGNRKKWTMSMWVKRSGLGATNLLFQSYVSTYTWCPFDANDRLEFQDGNGGLKRTNMRFRDTNAWYHIVVAIDTDLSTADDRYKIYVNGERITSFESSTNPTQGYEGEWNKAQLHNIGRHHSAGQYHNGLMSHIHFCDGYQYQASDFGETDSVTGEWKIKSEPSVSYGTTGFFILKDGNSVTDQSSNSNDWTANGTLTKTEDNPSNNFSTLNSLYTFDASLNYTKGNTVVADSGGSDSWTTRYAISSLGMIKGKYYVENKIANIGSNQMYVMGIISDPSANAVNSSLGYLSNAYGYYCADGRIISGTSDLQTGIGSATTNDIIGCALDVDNGTMQLYKNGSAIGSQVTGIPVGDRTWHFVSDFYSTGKIGWNFGNGYFEETAVSSAGTNASNIGIFEYDVPAGFTALSTKGINSF